MAAGLWPLSFQQRLDVNGTPYVGARAFFYEATTLTPVPIWQNYDLSLTHANPVEADGYGVFPAVFIDVDEEFYRFRITTAEGVILTDLNQLPVIGPTGGGGGAASPVDANALLQTGDTKWRLGTGLHSGWVRVNGSTIGNAASGATERANSDTEALYSHIYLNFSDTLCPVSGGRGVSAAADYAANKTITLPDVRGRTLAGLDDMGNSAAGRLTATYITTGDAITLGGAGGTQTHTLTIAETASHTHGSGSTGSDGAHTHFLVNSGSGGSALASNEQILETGTIGADTEYSLAGTSNNANSGLSSSEGAHTHSIATAGGGSAHLNLQPTYLATLYVRL